MCKKDSRSKLCVILQLVKYTTYMFMKIITSYNFKTLFLCEKKLHFDTLLSPKGVEILPEMTFTFTWRPCMVIIGVDICDAAQWNFGY